MIQIILLVVMLGILAVSALCLSDSVPKLLQPARERALLLAEQAQKWIDELDWSWWDQLVQELRENGHMQHFFSLNDNQDIVYGQTYVSVQETVETGIAYTFLTQEQQEIYKAYLSTTVIPETGWTEPLYAKVDVSEDGIMTAVSAVFSDHPEIFWYEQSVQYHYRKSLNGENRIVEVSAGQPSVSDYGQWQQMKAELEAAASEILSQIDLSKSQAEIALALHDVLLERVEYDNEAAAQADASVGNAYEALLKGKTVCSGYVQAYSYLLGQCGIMSVYIESEELNHAWNLIYLDNGNEIADDDWYEVDLTWDDQNIPFFQHDYFNLTTEEMLEKHRKVYGVGVRTQSGLSAVAPLALGTTFSYIEE
ncbi:MAG: transglutaminase domain-containing protein [Lachnospiraceae bacterium]